MAVILPKVFAAFRKVGVPEELAEAAAGEPVGIVLDLGNRVTRLDDRVTRLEVRVARLEVKLNVLLTLNVAILLLLLRESVLG